MPGPARRRGRPLALAPPPSRPGWAEDGRTAPQHLLGTRMATGSQRPLNLGRQGAWPVSCVARELRPRGIRVPPGWTRCGPDGQLLPGGSGPGLPSLPALLRVGGPAPARDFQPLIPARSERSRSWEESEVASARTCTKRPGRSPLLHPMTPPPPPPPPAPAVLNNLSTRFSNSRSSRRTKLLKVLWWWLACVSSQVTASLASGLDSLLRDFPLLTQ